MRIRITLAIVALSMAASALAQQPYGVAWVRQIATPQWDLGWAVAADGLGNSYFGGDTDGNLLGEYDGNDDEDIFVVKHDAAGNQVWLTQIGTTSLEHSHSIAVDAAGSTYLSGFSAGDLDGATPGGGPFIVKLDTAGDVAWIKQFASAEDIRVTTLDVDPAGNIYAGGNNDAGAVVSKFDTMGNELWRSQIGTTDAKIGYRIAVDDLGNTYASGETTLGLTGPTAGGTDVFVIKVDTLGNTVWTAQMGTSADDDARSVAVDSAGNTYVGGYTAGDTDYEAILAKFDADGNPAWMRTITASIDVYGDGVAMDDSGDVYITGGTIGEIGDNPAGGMDVFLAKFDSTGNEMWIAQAGTTSYEYGYGVAVGPSGVFVSGSTFGSFGGPAAGEMDTFVMKFAGPVGDFNGDHAVTGDDIDALADFIRSGSAYDSTYNVSGPGDDGQADGNVDTADLDYLVHFLVETAIGEGTEYGDFNLDGIIDTTDLTRLATDYGPGDTWAKGNANRHIDLTTDTTDLTILATYYGFGEPDTIPEPATLSLLALGACLPLFRRKRR